MDTFTGFVPNVEDEMLEWIFGQRSAERFEQMRNAENRRNQRIADQQFALHRIHTATHEELADYLRASAGQHERDGMPVMGAMMRRAADELTRTSAPTPSLEQTDAK